MFTVRMCHERHEETKLSFEDHMPLGLAMDEIARRMGRTRDQLVFTVFDGDVLDPEDSIVRLGLDSEDVIKVGDVSDSFDESLSPTSAGRMARLSVA